MIWIGFRRSFSPPTSPKPPAASLRVTLLRLLYIRTIKYLHNVKRVLLYSITSFLFTLKFTHWKRPDTTNYSCVWRCFYQSRADEMLVTNYHPTRLRIPKDSIIYAHVCENVQYHRWKQILNKWKTLTVSDYLFRLIKRGGGLWGVCKLKPL